MLIKHNGRGYEQIVLPARTVSSHADIIQNWTNRKQPSQPPAIPMSREHHLFFYHFNHTAAARRQIKLNYSYESTINTYSLLL